MAETQTKNCETCGHSVDNRPDALVYCRLLCTHVCRYSEPCNNWINDAYF